MIVQVHQYKRINFDPIDQHRTLKTYFFWEDSTFIETDDVTVNLSGVSLLDTGFSVTTPKDDVLYNIVVDKASYIMYNSAVTMGKIDDVVFIWRGE